MLEDLRDLAKAPTSDKRRELLGAVSDLFYAGGRDRVAEDEIRLFVDIVTRVLKDLSTHDRAEFSSKAAFDPRTPRKLALALANDDASVASPVLQHSPAMLEKDLISVAHKDMGHRIAIARRANVGERVTDVLLEFAETEVMHSLIDNAGSHLSDKGFNTIADRSVSVTELREKLCLRKDAPASVLERLLPLLDGGAREQALVALENENGQLDRFTDKALASLAKSRGEAARRRLKIKAAAKLLARKDIKLDAYVSELIGESRALDVALGLSLICPLPERQIANAVLSTDSRPLALICRALAIPARSYALVESLRRESMKLPSTVPTSAMRSYEDIDATQAQRALRFVNVRATLAPTG